MVIAGFDLGGKCGYAVLTEDGYRVTSGTWRLGKRNGASVQRFEELLESLLAEGISAVGYEKVRRHRGVDAAHAYGAYEAILWKVCHNAALDNALLLQVTVQDIKRAATGKGSAEKEEIEGAAMLRWAYLPEDDNEADALWCAEFARMRLVRAR